MLQVLREIQVVINHGNFVNGLASRTFYRCIVFAMDVALVNMLPIAVQFLFLLAILGHTNGHALAMKQLQNK